MNFHNLKHIAIFSFILCSNIAFAQSLPTIKNNVKDSLFSLYLHIPYSLEVLVHNADPSFIEVKAPNANIQKMSDTLYLITYSNTSEASKIKLYYKNLPIDIMQVKVEAFNAPVVKLMGSSGPNISKFALKNLTKIELDLHAASNANNLQLYSCRVFISEPGKPMTFNTILNKLDLPEQLSSMIKNLAPSSTIRFDEFMMKTPQNQIFNASGSSVTFIVVE